MEMLGAKVTGVSQGAATLSDAVDFAIMQWVNRIDDTFYLLGSAVGPHPFPSIVRYFQSVIGEEARRQIIEQESRLPNYVIACVGRGSNAIAEAIKLAPALRRDQIIIVNLSGRGDKDVESIYNYPKT